MIFIWLIIFVCLCFTLRIKTGDSKSLDVLEGHFESDFEHAFDNEVSSLSFQHFLEAFFYLFIFYKNNNIIYFIYK